jgi:hypothetical protein
MGAASGRAPASSFTMGAHDPLGNQLALLVTASDACTDHCQKEKQLHTGNKRMTRRRMHIYPQRQTERWRSRACRWPRSRRRSGPAGRTSLTSLLRSTHRIVTTSAKHNQHQTHAKASGPCLLRLTSDVVTRWTAGLPRTGLGPQQSP